MGFSNCIDLPSQLQKKEMAEYLIENGANGNSTCSKLKTLLHFALMLNHEEFVLLLLQGGAFFNAKDQDKRTPIEDTSQCCQMITFQKGEFIIVTIRN